MPWFGASTPVWANVIGVTLAGVAVGNFLGGHLASAGRGRGALIVLLLVAAALAAATPYVVPTLARRYLPDSIELASGYRLLSRASLLCATAAFAPPLMLLGAISPVLVREAARALPVGRAAGWVSAWGTIGSLVGTFVPVYFSIPTFGSRATCLGVAALLALSAAVAAPRAKGAKAARLVAVIVAVAFGLAAVFVPRAVGRSARSGAVLEELETEYQYARVEADGARVALRLNEGLDSYHSLTVRGQVLTDGAYFDYYSLLLPVAVPNAAGRRSARVLILGFAAGTIGRQLLSIYGDRFDLEITGVELDPAVARLGGEQFELPSSPRVHVLTDIDARTFVQCTSRRFDLIVVDVYAQQVYVPFQTCTAEFFQLCRDRLEPEGLLAANLSGFSVRDASIRAISNTAAKVFGDVSVLRVAGGRNFVLISARDGDVPSRDAILEAAPSALQPLRDAVSREDAWVRCAYRETDTVLTDDRSGIELLCDRDLFERARRLVQGAREAR